MVYTHILWDFNGTILNDVETGITSVNTLLRRRGMPLLSNVDDYHEVFMFPIVEYYQKLGFDFERESFDDLAVEWVNEYLYNVRHAKVRDGVIETLSKIQVPQIVLSATEINMLKEQLIDLGILKYFSEIIGLDNIKAGSKIDIAMEWVERVKPKSAVLIGDTIHDYETATAMGIDCILVAGGHQSKDTLLECGVPVLNNVSELLNEVI